MVLYPQKEKQKREESWKMVQTNREGHWVVAELDRSCLGRVILSLGNVYRPPSSDASFMTKLEVMVEKAVSECKHVVLMGDFNVNLLRTSSQVEHLLAYLCKWQQNGTRCRDGVKVLWCHSHLFWLVFEASIPTWTCFPSENFLCLV